MSKEPKGMLCPRCERYTYWPIKNTVQTVEAPIKYECSNCGHEGEKPWVKQKKTGPKGINLREDYVDPSRLYLYSSDQAKANININLRLKYKALINSVLSLSKYEEDILSTLLAAESPLSVRNIMLIASVPRTKVYGTIKVLSKAGLVELFVIDLDPTKLPNIWPFWPEKKQSSFLKANRIGLQVFKPVREAITQAYERKEREWRIIESQKKDVALFEQYLGIKR